MELLQLKKAYCAEVKRSDISRSISKVVAVITTSYPKDIFWMGHILPVGSSTEGVFGWLLGYCPSNHMVYAKSVPVNSQVSLLEVRHRLYTTEGAFCDFIVDAWDVTVTIEKSFNELNANEMNEAALVASLVSITPERMSLGIDYSLFQPPAGKDVYLPYVTNWIGLDIPYGVKMVYVPDGVRHISVYTSLSEPHIYLPDSIVSCFISKDINLRLSVSRKFAKVWAYWSAVWGKPYKIKEDFVCTPDGLVTVRTDHN